MASRARALGGCLVAVACASRPPPPPVIETQEAELGARRAPPAAEGSSRPARALPQSAPPASAGKPGDTAPVVKLLDAGAEPRRALRHAFSKHKQVLSIAAHTRVKGANLPLPAIVITAPMVATIVQVNAAGDARFELTAGPFTSGGGPSGAAGALGGLMGGGGGPPDKVAGWGWVNSRGVMKEFQVTEGAAGGDAPVETGDPFPEEAVGVGARWEVTGTVREKDGPVQQVSVYELVSADKKGIRTKLTRTQTPMGQPDGATAAQSSGELVFRFGDVFPTGRLEMTRNMTVDLPGLDGATLQLSSEVTISRR
ncbi:MAG: hypothetical protein IT377_19630 [Polyangiaceae bacterium]|nr:hypothetical protein [Polyangiaceae bacterium]